ncbi:uncharacterized protein JCM15063_001190 [Sporobolomyces koalae]|uniref:uncharacterized protein n=1 Tax=Sporobolomyces koalae TaxID=500713 RepID=UPI00317FC66A
MAFALPARSYAPPALPAAARVGSAPPTAPTPAATSPAPMSIPVPPGTLPPGTIVIVGQYKVVVERFLSEGGFAHVYLATSEIPLPVGSPQATTKHVLKRMAVPDKRGVQQVGQEVTIMRQLRNHPKIVNMIEASVNDLPGGTDGSKGYEIYILMEWCQGGGIIDMMNTRLQNRMSEQEILKIFDDTVQAVAHMHYQSPPLIHRDLKVENILLSPPGTFKLCDFGSTTTRLTRDKVPTSVEAIQKVELDINKTTTLQYRAPELVDVWARKGYDEKIDIWALGVLLYKLCYYTTPFEENGPLAILNAQYKFLPFPVYSTPLRSLISSMLQERAESRPNIYQVHEMTCKLRGAAVKFENVRRFPSLPGDVSKTHIRYHICQKYQSAPAAAIGSSTQTTLPSIVSTQAASAAGPNLNRLPGLQSSVVSQVSPMRRGRPQKLESPASRPPNNGFGDSFDPTTAKSPELPVETKVELPSNFDMFENLGGSGGRGGSSVGQSREKDEEDEMKRFESTFPALSFDDDLLVTPAPPAKSTSPVPAQMSKPAPSPKPVGLDLTGEGPPLPRRPPSSNKLVSSSSPEPATERNPLSPGLPLASQVDSSATQRPLLVERGSQTSPHLLASWKNGSSSTNNNDSTPSKPQTTDPANGRSGLRQSSIPEFDLTSPPLDSAQPSSSQVPKSPVIDLLNDDDDDDRTLLDGFYKPGMVSPLPPSPALDQQPVQRSPSTSASPIPLPKPSMASKRMSFVPSSNATASIQDREKFRPIRKSIVGAGGAPTAGTGNVEGIAGESAKLDEATEKKEEVSSVEDRFPAVSVTAPSPTEFKKKNNEFEEVIERDDQDDGAVSSEEESTKPVPVAGKIQKPSFSDDEADGFAPSRTPVYQPKTTSSGPIRPRFGQFSNSRSSIHSTSMVAQDNRSSESLPTKLPSPSSGLITRSDTLSSQEEGGGDIDLGPALASIHKFAPRGNDQATTEDSPLQDQTEDSAKSSTLPPVAAPAPERAATLPPLNDSSSSSSTGGGFVPTRSLSSNPPLVGSPKPVRKPTGINSLVSRYEGMGTSLTGGPPPIGTKPKGLRKDSTGSNSTLGRDQVNPQRLPSRQLPEVGSQGVAATSSERPREPGFVRVPFKPTPPSSTTASPHNRYSLSLPPKEINMNAKNGHVEPVRGQNGQEEEEERFAGVRNMKSRWESMGQTPSTQTGSSGKRKSWAQI